MWKAVCLSLFVAVGTAREELTKELLRDKLVDMFEARGGKVAFDELMTDKELGALFDNLKQQGFGSPMDGGTVAIPLGVKRGTVVNGRADARRLNDVHPGTGYSIAEKRWTLDKHNDLRQHTAEGNAGDLDGGKWPKAKNMNKLFWDPAIANVAQHYSDKCNYGHNGYRHDQFYTYKNQATFEYPESGIRLGENIAYHATTGSYNEMDALGWDIQDWYDEHYDGRYTKYGECVGCGTLGHYTQMVWADTRYVGCGYSICDKMNGANAAFTFYYLVCDYYSSGNMGGDYPYESGTMSCASTCDSDRHMCEGSLCGGCASKEWTVCHKEGYSNCDEAEEKNWCPSNCLNNAGSSHWCEMCPAQCGTCPPLTPEAHCDDGLGRTIA